MIHGLLFSTQWARFALLPTWFTSLATTACVSGFTPGDEALDAGVSTDDGGQSSSGTRGGAGNGGSTSTTGGSTGATNQSGCIATTCEQLNASCGVLPNGCGDVIECGSCGSGSCESNGASWKCLCEPKTCEELESQCGVTADGCGGTLDCGGCTAPDQCVDNRCGCLPRSECNDGECGSVPDGCGGFLQCGTCTAEGEQCGGGGANRCGVGQCNPTTCEDVDANCNQISDGCGEIVSCGQCEAPQTCGGGRMENRCGCQPVTCGQAGVQCGSIDDGCGKTLQCPDLCQAPQTCGGGSADDNSCGCTAETCESLDAECGMNLPNGCGLTINCEACDPGDVCQIQANGGRRCVDACDAKSCDELGAECGEVDDGCGTLILCGDDETCAEIDPHFTCGGGGHANECGCLEATCDPNACGKFDDGCGGEIDCSCQEGYECRNLMNDGDRTTGVCAAIDPCKDVMCDQGRACCNGICQLLGVLCVNLP